MVPLALLDACKTKLQVYRNHSDGEYQGGMEHRALIDWIERVAAPTNDAKAHRWRPVSIGPYESVHECEKCKQRHYESIERPETKLPVHGCTNDARPKDG